MSDVRFRNFYLSESGFTQFKSFQDTFKVPQRNSKFKKLFFKSEIEIPKSEIRRLALIRIQMQYLPPATGEQHSSPTVSLVTFFSYFHQMVQVRVTCLGIAPNFRSIAAFGVKNQRLCLLSGNYGS